MSQRRKYRKVVWFKTGGASSWQVSAVKTFNARARFATAYVYSESVDNP